VKKCELVNLADTQLWPVGGVNKMEIFLNGYIIIRRITYGFSNCDEIMPAIQQRFRESLRFSDRIMVDIQNRSQGVG
jgi:hypothetical protein